MTDVFHSPAPSINPYYLLNTSVVFFQHEKIFFKSHKCKYSIKFSFRMINRRIQIQLQESNELLTTVQKYTQTEKPTGPPARAQVTPHPEAP